MMQTKYNEHKMRVIRSNKRVFNTDENPYVSKHDLKLQTT